MIIFFRAKSSLPIYLVSLVLIERVLRQLNRGRVTRDENKERLDEINKDFSLDKYEIMIYEFELRSIEITTVVPEL